MGKDEADVVAAAAQDRVEGIAERALERASCEAAVGLHVTDHRLDGAAPPEVALERRRHPAALSGDEDFDGFDPVTAVAAIDEGTFGAGSRQDLHLLEGLLQGMAVIGVAGHGAHADDEALPVGRRDRDLGAELVADTGFPLGEAVDRGLVEGVELALVLRLLAQQPVNEGDVVLDPIPQGGVSATACSWRWMSRITRPV